MLKVIIDKEIRDIISSTKFAVTFGVCALLLISAFYAGAVRYQVYQKQYEASVAENLRRLEGQTDWLSIQGTRIFLPPQPLSTLVSGISNDIGRKGQVTGGSEVSISGSRFNEDPVFAVFRFIDIEFVFSILLSLFAILLGYNSVSGEKEQGTLRLTFANPVPRHTYILGKLIGSWISLAVSVALASAIGCLLLPLMSIPMSGTDWAKLALIILTGLLYIGVFLSLSQFVSTLTHRSANSFLILLVFWIGSVMIIPRVSVLLAGRAVDVPSVDYIASQRTNYSIQLRDEFIDALSSFEMPQGVPMEESMSKFHSHMDSISEIRLSKMKALTERLNEDRFNRQQVQENLAFNLARISPTTSLTLATTALAGTSLGLKNEFRSQAMGYQDGYGRFIEEKTGMNPRGMLHIRRIEEGGEEPDLIDPSELPVFDFTPATPTAAFASAAVDFGLLVIFNLIFFAATIVAFLRYDVR